MYKDHIFLLVSRVIPRVAFIYKCHCVVYTYIYSQVLTKVSITNIDIGNIVYIDVTGLLIAFCCFLDNTGASKRKT